MGAVLDQAAALERDDAIRRANSGKPMRDQTNRPLAISFILLNDALALLVEGARRLIEDRNARVGDERANGDGVGAGHQRVSHIADDRVVTSARG